MPIPSPLPFVAVGHNRKETKAPQPESLALRRWGTLCPCFNDAICVHICEFQKFWAGWAFDEGQAVEEASFSVSGLKDASGKALPSVNGLCLGIYQKDGDQWFAVAVQCMVPPPQPK